jgi:hypothetical protein
VLQVRADTRVRPYEFGARWILRGAIRCLPIKKLTGIVDFADRGRLSSNYRYNRTAAFQTGSKESNP